MTARRIVKTVSLYSNLEIRSTQVSELNMFDGRNRIAGHGGRCESINARSRIDTTVGKHYDLTQVLN